MYLAAFDPGSEQTAIVLFDTQAYKVVESDYIPNEQAEYWLFKNRMLVDHLAIEMIASYGMPVGREVFETCVWIGRYISRYDRMRGHTLVYRKDVKMHLCGSMKAKDGNIRQALMDKFGGKNAVGTKKKPGPLYGISGDKWAALGVAVTFAETRK